MINRNKLSLRRLLFAASLTLTAGMFYSCSESAAEEAKLPILGNREPVERVVEGQTVVDTLYHQIPDFAFVNQDSQQVTQETFAGKLYVTDFFFTTCPTICPKMKSQMLRVYEQYKDNPNVLLLSHSIDPTHDTVAVLKDYAARLNVTSDKWHFVTGEKDSIYDIATKYMVTAMEDEQEAGGFVHSGAFVLVDENRHVRGVYDGTKPEEVDRLINDIPVLLKEQNDQK
ncbi:protein SCO1/2 [Pontibacter ummariensis]|uniref:Protein SCO1/2 n=1 Tax=Pontibacter ummariensis TaxID=1610492 RepID=A0A239INL7_9BACT|nr:SCO family protein [Pontibacter ummariensis]PRY09712.1 protein SCO1/2 [Pontibacter ummariensis]SNS95366.1 protein SCO1/2 [Pontibacter ummariensis]